MVGSLLKKANLSTSHRPTTCAAIFFICWRCLALAPWNRESEFSGSEPVYRKLFSHGPHSSKNNVFGIKISRPTPWVSLSVLLWLLILFINPELLCAWRPGIRSVSSGRGREWFKTNMAASRASLHAPSSLVCSAAESDNSSEDELPFDENIPLAGYKE